VLSKFGDLPIAAIDYGLVTAWVAELQHKGLAPATVRRCHLLLSKLLAGPRRNHIDTAPRVVRVDSTLTEVRGQLIPGRPKTAASVRSVPLPRTVTATLELAVRDLDDHAFVFTGSDGAPIRAGSFRARFWKPATDRADLVGLRMHDLRHTAVSLWIAHDASAKQVQVWAATGRSPPCSTATATCSRAARTPSLVSVVGVTGLEPVTSAV